MSLSHVLLTSLLEKPSSGYDLARRFDKSMAFFWHATHQQIYRELKKMQQAGWIDSYVPMDAGNTKKRIYHVLEAGKKELVQWVSVQTDPAQIREELLVRLRAEAILGPLGLEQELQRHLRIAEEKLAQFEAIEQKDFLMHMPLQREQIIHHQILKLGIESQRLAMLWLTETITRLKT